MSTESRSERASIARSLMPRREPMSRWADGLRGGFAVNGAFEIAHLEPGTYVVFANATLPDGSTPYGSASVEIPAEGEVEIALTLEQR